MSCSATSPAPIPLRLQPTTRASAMHRNRCASPQQIHARLLGTNQRPSSRTHTYSSCLYTSNIALEERPPQRVNNSQGARDALAGNDECVLARRSINPMSETTHTVYTHDCIDRIRSCRFAQRSGGRKHHPNSRLPSSSSTRTALRSFATERQFRSRGGLDRNRHVLDT